MPVCSQWVLLRKKKQTVRLRSPSDYLDRSRSADEGQSTDTLSLNLLAGGLCVCVCVCVCVLPGNVSPVPLSVLQRNAVVEAARSCRSRRLDRFRRQRCDKKTQREGRHLKCFFLFFSSVDRDKIVYWSEAWAIRTPFGSGSSSCTVHTQQTYFTSLEASSHTTCRQSQPRTSAAERVHELHWF